MAKKKRKPLMLMRKTGIAGSLMTKHANSTKMLSKSVGQFIEPNNKG